MSDLIVNGIVTPEDVERQRVAARSSTVLRIRCKCEPQKGRLVARLADYSDCEILAVADDGTEVRLDLVDRFEVRGEPGKHVTATLTFVGIELDVEAGAAPAMDDDGETAAGDVVRR